jgi:hypothetical protein
MQDVEIRKKNTRILLAYEWGKLTFTVVFFKFLSLYRAV